METPPTTPETKPEVKQPTLTNVIVERLAQVKTRKTAVKELIEKTERGLAKMRSDYYILQNDEVSLQRTKEILDETK